MSLRRCLRMPGTILTALFGGSSFLEAHITAISFAFWSSLLVAAATMLVVFLWPAALAAMVSYSLYGLTIAGLVGANITSQIAVLVGLSYILSNAAVYTLAFLGNLCSWFGDCCCVDRSYRHQYRIEDIDDRISSSTKKYRSLGLISRSSMTDPEVEEPAHYGTLWQTPQDAEPQPSESLTPTPT